MKSQYISYKYNSGGKQKLIVRVISNCQLGKAHQKYLDQSDQRLSKGKNK